MDNIRGKPIAITGAARGIGYASAKALLARGARVVIGDRDVALQESAVVDARGSVRYRVLLAERCGTCAGDRTPRRRPATAGVCNARRGLGGPRDQQPAAQSVRR